MQSEPTRRSGQQQTNGQDRRLSISLDELIAQCRRSVAWIRRNIARFGGDPNRISISGHSAGGHIVAMLLALGIEDAPDREDAQVIRAATALSGLYALEPIRLCYLNDTLHFLEEETERNSPYRLKPRLHVPLLLAVGRRERAEYVRQSQLLADAWAAMPCAPQLRLFDEDDHFTLRAQLGDPQSTAVAWMLKQRAAHGC